MAGTWTDAVSFVGVYHPGNSWLHRVPAGPKVAGLLVAVVAVLSVPSFWLAAVFAAASVSALLSTGVPVGRIASVLRAVAVMLLALVLVQMWLVGWQGAVTGISRVLACLTLAWAVSLTTPLTHTIDLLITCLRPLRRLGVDTELIAMTIALSIRSIPLVVAAVAQADEARRARGAHQSVRALIVPSVVRSVQIAEALGDGLIARGYGSRQDWDSPGKT